MADDAGGGANKGSWFEGTTFETRIDGLGVGGDGVGRLPDGRVVFIPGALPGDFVRARPGTATKQFSYGELVHVITPSQDRVDSRCTVALCSGCALRGASIDAQRRWKRERVLDALTRVGKLDVGSLLGDVQGGDAWRARHRVRLHAQWRGKNYRLGYYERRSHTLVPLDDCPILWSELEQAALSLERAIVALPEQAGLEEVEIVYSRRDGRPAASLRLRGGKATYQAWIEAQGPNLPMACVFHSPGSKMRLGNLELRYDHRRAAEYDLRFEPGVFTQANPEVNDLLVDAVVERVRSGNPKAVLELHAGAGNLSLPLAMAGLDVTAVEGNARSALFCERNARGAGLSRITVHTLSDDAALSLANQADTVVLDPPRTGAKSVAVRLGKRTSVRRIVYVSCDPATLARDAAQLVSHGFKPTSLAAFDMFPETPHVETVMVLDR